MRENVRRDDTWADTFSLSLSHKILGDCVVVDTDDIYS